MRPCLSLSALHTLVIADGQLAENNTFFSQCYTCRYTNTDFSFMIISILILTHLNSLDITLPPPYFYSPDMHPCLQSIFTYLTCVFASLLQACTQLVIADGQLVRSHGFIQLIAQFVSKHWHEHMVHPHLTHCQLKNKTCYCESNEVGNKYGEELPNWC